MGQPNKKGGRTTPKGTQGPRKPPRVRKGRGWVFDPYAASQGAKSSGIGYFDVLDRVASALDLVTQPQHAVD